MDEDKDRQEKTGHTIWWENYFREEGTLVSNKFVRNVVSMFCDGIYVVGLWYSDLKMEQFA